MIKAHCAVGCGGDVYKRQALDKLAEEAQELREAVQDDTNIDEELGDLLFDAVLSLLHI